MGNNAKCKRCDTPMKKTLEGQYCDICLREIREMGLTAEEYTKMRANRELQRQS